MSEGGTAEMESVASTASPLRIAAGRIDSELARRPSRPMSMSRQAREALALAHAEYLGALGEESVRLARRDRLTTVDAEHVDQAIRRLGQARSGSTLSDAANSLGGLLAGAGVASVYSIVFMSGPHSTAELLTALALSTMGFSSLVYGLTSRGRS